MKYAVKKQVGGAWGVYWEVPGNTYDARNLMSGHDTEAEANKARKRYVTGDKRRATMKRGEEK